MVCCSGLAICSPTVTANCWFPSLIFFNMNFDNLCCGLFSCSQSSVPGSRRGSRRPSRKFTQFQMPGNFDQKVRFEPTHTTHLVYLLHDHTPSLLMCPSPYPFLPLTRSSSSSSLSYTTVSYIISLSPHHTPPTASHILPLSHNTPCPSHIILHSLPWVSYNIASLVSPSHVFPPSVTLHRRRIWSSSSHTGCNVWWRTN